MVAPGRTSVPGGELVCELRPPQVCFHVAEGRGVRSSESLHTGECKAGVILNSFQDNLASSSSRPHAFPFKVRPPCLRWALSSRLDSLFFFKAMIVWGGGGRGERKGGCSLSVSVVLVL